MSKTNTHFPPTVGILPVRRGVLLPGTSMSIPVGRARSVALIEGVRAGDIIGVAAQRDPETEEPVLADLHEIGTYAKVTKVNRTSDTRTFRIVVEGLSRFAIVDLVQTDPSWVARVEPAPDPDATDEARLLAEEIRHSLSRISGASSGLAEILASDPEPGELADRVASGLDVERHQEVEVLLTKDVPARLRLVVRLIAQAKARAELKSKIGAEVRRELEKDQRKHMLRQQMRAIQKELGEDGGADDVIDKLREKLDAAGLPEEAEKVAERELGRLQAIGNQGPEANVIRTYLEWIADLPWETRADTTIDIDKVQAKLDADHYGLDKVKERILEHLAVAQLRGGGKGTILCLAGPPGVGKTSLGQSIADATGRPFVRVALGGVRDESEIRGHRRTYVGALPGRLLSALRKVKVKNPVIMLDEVDKLGTGWQGSPEAALLEVLDPEQNHTFTDHYLELPFDLSEVMFVATVNSLEPLSAPLRDRLEIIQLSGYTHDEKREIAKNHLVPKKLGDHALDDEALALDDEAIDLMISDYTREAGVRQLGQQINKVCRSVALQVVRSSSATPPKVQVTAESLRTYLGKARFFNELAERTSVAGVATGLAWTPVGGDILFIETSRMPGKGGLQITGKLGEVMQESAKAAMTYVRSNADMLGVDTGDFAEHDVHIHVPAGAVPKDGPSAGVTMFTAITSLLTGRRVRSDTAMTGECTLRGKVLPVGGIKEKVLAAHRAGIKRIILPAQNERDIDDVPEATREQLQLIFAHDMTDVLHAALEPMVPTTPDAGDSMVSSSAS